MGMISLGFRAGDKAVLIIKGEDEEAALSDMADLFENL
jgi:phosphotransferase system HPr-like phosphotransfer protein